MRILGTHAGGYGRDAPSWKSYATDHLNAGAPWRIVTVNGEDEGMRGWEDEERPLSSRASGASTALSSGPSKTLGSWMKRSVRGCTALDLEGSSPPPLGSSSVSPRETLR